MTGYVIDASALLAIIRSEIGADRASARMRGASMSTVNASEALMRGAEKGTPLDLMRAFLASQDVHFLDFDADLAVRAALLRPSTKRAGLSFADRVWADLDLPCPVELIR